MLALGPTIDTLSEPTVLSLAEANAKVDALNADALANDDDWSYTVKARGAGAVIVVKDADGEFVGYL